jgi:hypothetical protein
MVLGDELVRTPGWRPRRQARAQHAVAVPEAEAAVGVVLDRVPTFVHQAVVVEAEQDDLEARLPPLAQCRR